MSRRNIIACLCGQSNERGRRWLSDAGGGVGDAQVALYGPICQDPLPPKGAVAGPAAGANGSWWPRLVEKLARERDIFLTVKNTAVGATAIVEHWCGDPSGVGTGIPYNKDDVGFDPNNYLADALSAVNEGNFSERWAFISIGQADASNSVSLANFQLALENATNYFLANNIKVAIGFTCYQTANAAWFLNNGSPAWTNAIATFSANTNVISGANLYQDIGQGIVLYDGSHMDARSYDLSADAWFEALNIGL